MAPVTAAELRDEMRQEIRTLRAANERMAILLRKYRHDAMRWLAAERARQAGIARRSQSGLYYRHGRSQKNEG